MSATDIEALVWFFGILIVGALFVGLAMYAMYRD